MNMLNKNTSIDEMIREELLTNMLSRNPNTDTDDENRI